MDSKLQSGINFSNLVSGYDLMESAGKHWMEAVSRIFPGNTEGGEKSNMPGMDALKGWQQWYLDKFNIEGLRTADMQTLATACIEQQKRCSEMQLAWWRCSIKALQTIGRGMRNGDHPAQIMKTCMELSEEYVRSCADFLAAQSEALSEYAAEAPIVQKLSTDKAKRVKMKVS